MAVQTTEGRGRCSKKHVRKYVQVASRESWGEKEESSNISIIFLPKDSGGADNFWYCPL